MIFDEKEYNRDDSHDSEIQQSDSVCCFIYTHKSTTLAVFMHFQWIINTTTTAAGTLTIQLRSW